MIKEELIKYIRNNDTYFENASLQTYSGHELMLIKISIDSEQEKTRIKNSSSDILSSRSTAYC